MDINFPTDYRAILSRLNAIDPVRYGKSRNFVNGAVTHLSPYISRGVISTRQVLDSVLRKGLEPRQIETVIRELSWRDYFQRVGQCVDLDADIRHPQSGVSHNQMPTAVLEARTGIDALDDAIRGFYRTGYMHNHCRMYVASVVCNVAKAHWLTPARWMYYHLLDGDWASNACSWQWVAGTNSSKKYFASQENINRYALTEQKGTFLDVDYSLLDKIPVPEVLLEHQPFNLFTAMPASEKVALTESIPVFVYNYYNLDPFWHRGESGHRVLLLEPDFFERFPVSPKCMAFAIALAANIPNIRLFVGSFADLAQSVGQVPIHFKEHPLNVGYRGIEEPRDWLVPELGGYFPSFFAYWKKAEKKLMMPLNVSQSNF